MSFWLWLEIVGVLFSLGFIVLLAFEKIWCWVFSFLGASVSVILFVYAQLYAESLAYVAYAIISLYCWKEWYRNAKKYRQVYQKEISPILLWSFKQHALLFAFSVPFALLIGYIFDTYTNATYAYVDALTTVFGLVATYMEARKILSAWLFWIVLNALSVYLYYMRDLNLYAILFILYTVFSVLGFWRWRWRHRKQIAMSA